MTGTVEHLDRLERIGHHKIPFGRTFGSQMLALGMLYFSVGDLL